MIALQPYTQAPSHCGPASLKMVLGYYGISVSEKILARESGCTFEEGTSVAGLRKAAKIHGCKTEVVDDGTIEMVRDWVEHMKIPVIVHWFSHDTGHYSVVVRVTSTHITLMDPEIGKRRTVTHAVFLQVWFGFRYSHIRSNTDLIIRRSIIVLPPSVS